jgi:hypothetical protein
MNVFRRLFPHPGVEVNARVVGHQDIVPERYLNLGNGTYTGEDFSNRDLDQLSGGTATVGNCSFDGSRIQDCDFGYRRGAFWVDCSFDGVHIEHASGVARFERCSFRDVVLQEWWCFEVEMIDCVFTGLLNTVVFNGTVPKEYRKWVGRQRNAFEGNDFSGADLFDVAFRTGIDLDRQKLPTGDNYLYLQDARRIIDRAKQLSRDSDLEVARRWLASQEEQVERGQTQLLLDRRHHNNPFNDNDRAFLGWIEQAMRDLGLDPGA